MSSARLATVLARTLEQMAMVLADPAPVSGATPPPASTLARGRIRFRGAESGELVVLASERTAATIAANVLGTAEDSAETAEAALDAFAELLNVTLGQLLTELSGTEAEFDLDPPEVEIGVERREWEELAEAPNSVVIDAEDELVAASFRRDERPAGGGDEAAGRAA